MTVMRLLADVDSNTLVKGLLTKLKVATASGVTLAPFLGITTLPSREYDIVAVFHANGQTLNDVIALRTPATVGHVKQLMTDVVHAILFTQREGFPILIEDIRPEFVVVQRERSNVVRFQLAGCGCFCVATSFTLGDAGAEEQPDPRDVSQRIAAVVSQYVIASFGGGVDTDFHRRGDRQHENNVPIQIEESKSYDVRSPDPTTVEKTKPPLSSAVKQAAAILRRLHAHSLADILVNCDACQSLKTWSLASLMLQLQSISVSRSNNSVNGASIALAKPPMPHVPVLQTMSGPVSALAVGSSLADRTVKRWNVSHCSLASEALLPAVDSRGRLQSSSPHHSDEYGRTEPKLPSVVSPPTLNHRSDKITNGAACSRRASLNDTHSCHWSVSRDRSLSGSEDEVSKKSAVIRVNSLAKLSGDATTKKDSTRVHPSVSAPLLESQAQPTCTRRAKVGDDSTQRRESLIRFKTAVPDPTRDDADTSFDCELQDASQFPSEAVLDSLGIITSRRPADLLLSTLAALDDHSTDLPATLTLTKVLHSLSQSKKRVSLLASITCMRRIVRAVSIHITSVELQSQCCDIMHALCGVKGGSVVVLESGGVAAINDMLQLASSSVDSISLCEKTLNLAQKLSIKHTTERRLWESLHCCRWFDMFSGMLASDPVVLAMLRVFVIMTRNVTVAVAFTSIGFWSPVLSLLQARVSNVEITELCLYIACNLSNCLGNVPAVCTQAAALAVIGTMETHSENGNVQQLGCAALCLFATTKGTARILSHSFAVNSILTAMRSCPYNVGLQANACQALCYMISFSPEELSEAVFKAVRLADAMFPNEPDITRQARAIKAAYERMQSPSPSPQKAQVSVPKRNGFVSRLTKRFSL
jgi:hypothetical protein